MVARRDRRHWANGKPQIVFAGDSCSGVTFVAKVRIIGALIRYFRKPYPRGALNQSYLQTVILMRTAPL
jgi:hypothetical protein